MTANRQNRAPTHRLYIVKDTAKGEQARWLEIGAAWPNLDGHGFSLRLDANPIDGRLVMREIATGEIGGQP